MAGESGMGGATKPGCDAHSGGVGAAPGQWYVIIGGAVFTGGQKRTSYQPHDC